MKYNSDRGDKYEACRCGGVFVLRDGKQGRFYGCSNYPKCKQTRTYKPTCRTCDNFEPDAQKYRYCPSTDPNDSCERHPERSALNWVEKICNKHKQNMIRTTTESEEKGVFIVISVWTCSKCLLEKEGQ